MLLQFAAMNLGGTAVGGGPQQILKLLIIQQLALFATPALLMAALLTTDLPRTLKLRGASLKYFAAAILLAVALRPLSTELVTYLQQINFLPSLDEATQMKMAEMLDVGQPGWLAFLAIAVAPGICEEVAFRGFILTAVSRGGRTTLAIVLSAIAFGVVHLIPHQVFYASLLGLVLGLIAVRSGSLLPGIVFHILFNGWEVLARRVPDDAWSSPTAEWFFHVEAVEGDLAVGYSALTLVICGVVGAALIVWLIRDRRPRQPDSSLIAGQASLAT